MKKNFKEKKEIQQRHYLFLHSYRQYLFKGKHFAGKHVGFIYTILTSHTNKSKLWKMLYLGF